ncbi:MAG: DUF302 domain-containing protein [Lentimicrobium sp.]
MKIKLIISVLILSSGLMAAAQSANMEKPVVLIESMSRFGFAETVEILSKTIVEQGWKVTITHDLQETMKKNGKEVLPVKVIELCNPGHAFNILSKDEFRDVSALLPCRISVYEKADGKTYVSRMNAPAFAGMIGGQAGETIVKAFDETEVMMKGILK